jgi:hypothetical protein
MSARRRRLARFGPLTATVALLVGLGATALPALGSQSHRVFLGRFTLIEHDTTQQTIDLGAPGPSVGDQFIIGGDVLDRQGGSRVGRSAGQCSSTSDTEILCATSFTVQNSQIAFQGIVDTTVFFSGDPVDFAVTGGTGRYRRAHGTVTVRILPNPPSGTDAELRVDLT